MKQLNAVNRIAELFARYVALVKGLNAISQFGINYLSETVLVPIFKEIYEFDALRNLNNESVNFPGIDLADEKNAVAFQITSTLTIAKVKSTIRTFVENKGYSSYQRLIFYSITEKDKKAMLHDYSNVINQRFEFAQTRDILDYTDLLKFINGIEDVDKILRIQTLLEKQFGETELHEFKQNFSTPKYEEVISNLLEITFPENLYIGTLKISRRDLSNPKKKVFNDRDMIYEFKRENGLRFSADWIDMEKQIITFHDLSNSNHDISKLVDLGTVDAIAPIEFYSQSASHVRAFKALLRFCLSKQLSFFQIEYFHEEKIYVFMPKDRNSLRRTESWNSGKKNARREVVKAKEHKSKDGMWYHTHLAFEVNFRLFEDKWFAEINPDWFITRNGYDKHRHQNEHVPKFLKKKERNQHVLNHLKFIANYLKNGGQQISIFNLEDRRQPMSFIRFQNLMKFPDAPFLEDSDWATAEPEGVISEMKDANGMFETEL